MRRPGLCLAVAAFLTVVFGFGVTRLELRTDGATLFPLGDPSVRLTREDQEKFRDPERVILLVSSRRRGVAVARPEGFREIWRLHESLSHLRAVAPGGVRSLASLAQPLEGSDALVNVAHYLDQIPDAPRGFSELLVRLRAHPLVNGLFLAKDGRTSALYVSLDSKSDREAALAELQRWAAGERKRGPFDLRFTGPMVAEVELGHTVVRDLAWLTPLMALAIGVLLFLALRTPGAVIVASTEVLVVLVWTLGAMGYFGVPITLVTTILPVILLSMAVADEVHILERLQVLLRQGRRGGERLRREDVRDRLSAALTGLRNPIVLTSLTTAVGFFSFPSGTLQPLRQFGLFAGFGILLAMVTSFSVNPAVAVLLPPSWFEPARLFGGSRRPGGQAHAFESKLAGHETGALLIGLLMVGCFSLGIYRLTVQDSWIDNFDPRSPVVSAERDFNANFWGSYAYDVVLRSKVPGFFRSPEGVALAERVVDRAARGPFVGGVLSYLTPLRLIGDIIGKPGLLSGLERQDLRTINALSFVLRRDLDLYQLLSLDGRSCRLRLYVKSPNYERSAALDGFMKRELPGLVKGAGTSYHFSGDLPLSIGVVRAIVSNQLRSISWTLIGVAAIILVAYRSLRAVIVILAPVVGAAAAVFGLMGYTGLPLGIASSMFAALSVGAGVDFAIHFWHVYEAERRRGGDHLAGANAALEVSGPAIRWNALVLSLSFLVLTLSALRPNRVLGSLLACAILAAYACTMLLLPRLIRRP